MKEPRNPYDDTPTESEKSEKKPDIVELLLYWLFAVPMASIGLLVIGFIISAFIFLVWYSNRY